MNVGIEYKLLGGIEGGTNGGIEDKLLLYGLKHRYLLTGYVYWWL